MWTLPAESAIPTLLDDSKGSQSWRKVQPTPGLAPSCDRSEHNLSHPVASSIFCVAYAGSGRNKSLNKTVDVEKKEGCEAVEVVPKRSG